MNDSWLFFLFLTLLCVVLEGFFSMFEMACVSLNKIRLQYAVSKQSKRAIWLSFLLDKPIRLFGTTLIASNTFLQIGSEASRRLYESLDLSPDWAPISQIFLVVIFAELAPMFAARRHAEHVSMLAVPVAYALSKCLAPIIWMIDGFSNFLHRLIGKSQYVPFFLSKEEVQRAFEEKAERVESQDREDFVAIIGNIFTLKHKTAKQLMIPIQSVSLVPSQATLQEVVHFLSVSNSSFIPIYHREFRNIVGVVSLRDLLRIDEKRRIVDFATPPWFITEGTSILEILSQFRRNNQSVAVVLNSSGQAMGILTLDEVIDAIFGEMEKVELLQKEAEASSKLFLERTFPGGMLLSDFNEKFGAHLSHEKCETLSDLITAILKHHPVKGEAVRVGSFEMVVLEPSLLGAKTISIRTLH